MSKTKNIYLIANYSARPKDPKMTSKAGYISNPNNVEYDEFVSISKGLRDKDMSNNVILDLTEEKIVKNSFKSNSGFMEIFEHFYNSYGDYIDKSVKELNGIKDEPTEDKSDS